MASSVIKWASPKFCGNIKEMGHLGSGVHQSFLETVMVLGPHLKGKAGVSPSGRGRITRTSQLTGCRSQRRECRRFKTRRFQDRTIRIVKVSLMLAQKTERGTYFLVKG